MSRKSETNKAKSGARKSNISRTLRQTDPKTKTRTKSAPNREHHLQAEIEALRARVAEAEETLRAIRGGEVDALVVSKAGGDQVFTLKGAEHTYRVLVEEMSEGAVTLDSAGTVLYCNNAFASMLETPLEEVIGSSLRDYIAPQFLVAFDKFVQEAILRNDYAQAALKKAKGGILHVLLSGRKSSMDGITGVSIVVTDISLQKEAEEILRMGHKELELIIRERTVQLKTQQDELEIQNEQLRSAQLELETSRARYEDFYHCAPVGYFTLDSHGIIQEVNRAGAATFGADRSSLLKKSFSLLIPDSDEKLLFSSHLKITFTAQTDQRCDLKLRRRDDTAFYAELKSIAVENADGKAGFIRTMISDITERKQMERALQESEQKYRMLFENMTASFALCEIVADDRGKPRDYRYLDVNTAYEKLSGAPREKILSKTALEHNPSLETYWLEKFGTVAGTGRSMLFEHYHAHLGKWLEVYAYAPQAGQFACIISDTTARKQSEEALRRSEEQFKNIFSQSPIGIALYDADGKLIELNRSAMKMFGLKGLEDMPEPDLFAGPAEEKKKHLLRGEPVQQEVFYDFQKIKESGLHKTERTGTAYFDRLITPLMTGSDKPHGYLVQIQDVTERKLVQNQLIQFKEGLEAEIRDMNLLHKLSTRFIEGDDLGSILDEMIQAAITIAGAQKGNLQLLDQATGKMKIVAHKNFSSPFLQFFNEVQAGDASACGQVMTKLERVTVEDVTQSPVFSDSRTLNILLREGIRAVESTPVLARSGKLLGIISVHFMHVRRVDDRKSRVIEIMARLAADIIERKQAENALRQNEDRLREYLKLLEYAPVMVRNMQEEIILWNKGMEKMYGYSSAEAINQKPPQLLKSEFPQSLENIFDELNRTGRWEGDVLQRTRDGNRIIVTSLWILHKNSDGKPTAVIEINTDITERRRAEEALRRLNEELEARVQVRTNELAKTIRALQGEITDRRIADEALRKSQISLAKAQSIAHIGSWSYDLQTEKMTWSEELYKICGIKPGAFDDNLDSVIGSIIHPEDWDKVRKGIRQVLSTSKTETMEYRILLPDGRPRVVAVEAEVVFDDAGKPASVVGTVQDITDRKRAEEDISRLVTAVESAVDAVVVTEPVKGIILYVNPAFEKITGYARDEVVGRDLHMLDSGTHNEEFYRELRETLKREGSWSGRFIHKKKDGTLYEEECTYSPVRNSEGKTINYISIKRDVTEKVRLESIAQAVETMNNIGYIFSGVSHEIGNPINAASMTLDIIRKKLESLPKEKIAEYVDRVITQISRVEYLLKSLKNFNMYENVQPRAIETVSFFETFLSVLTKDFESKRIVIDCSIDPKAVYMFADPRALQQVLLNVLTNASDAVNGRENPKVKLNISERAGMVRIKVKDNGCGIEESRLKDLFRPFHTTKQHGTGLGLVIIKKMLAKMNGTVEIKSHLNKGTTVEIALPSRQPGA